MFALILICVLLLMLIYGRRQMPSVKEGYNGNGQQSGTFDGFMEYNNMYYIVFYGSNDDRLLANRGPLQGHYIKIPCLDPNGTYEVAQRRDVFMPQAINPNGYTEIVGQNFRALPILRAGGDSLTGNDIIKIREHITNAAAGIGNHKSHTWSYVGRDMRSVPSSLFKPDQTYNQYFQNKIYKLFDSI
jgi:hypothetical protein